MLIKTFMMLLRFRLIHAQFVLDCVHFNLKVNFALLLNILTLVLDYVHETKFHVVLFIQVLELQNGLFADVKRLVDFVFQYSQIVLFEFLIFVKAEVRAYVLVGFWRLVLILQTFTRFKELRIFVSLVREAFIPFKKAKIRQLFKETLRDELNSQLNQPIIDFLLGQFLK